ncbi:hypothetical protein MEN41_21720 [Dolichospermum sp. ST_con]|nr:hypothetical protein [Dolichospermum sp. ST_con]MDD1422565.1 hypothetical protein [Dolichospermum sp. ST_sed1]MDD1428489.1 hypothetical protein [Dolichospermum sp. ST_sed9]MDD1434530.1 hypothetical protein [Dolichospermum sp. ST_sed6]MDD1438097.1 hypothetical protein [Dolichospermum sp. ST_sed10]MDD1443913.1 hypothetical protein [Dolichospermum sp. ST_sed3]MDD1449433.1 hypothetical protein [Dolichospermum sp. ST_sed8]MDD1458215.1 hypothetical protein [Dolichospermum sp. ST_sed7]MDD146343
MITRVEPSGVILKDICEIQTEKCVAKDLPAAITAVWYSPGRKQVNVCRSCLDEMVRRGEWEVKGARLSPRPDITNQQIITFMPRRLLKTMQKNTTFLHQGIAGRLGAASL